MKLTAILEARKTIWKRSRDVMEDKDFTTAFVTRLLEPQNSVQYRRSIAERPELLIELIFVIVDKHARVVPFFLNDVQKEFVTTLREAIDAKSKGERRHLKFLILKGRQQGFTSVIFALQLAIALVNQNFSGYILTDDASKSGDLFTKKLRYQFDRLDPRLKPTEMFNSKREIYLPKLNNAIKVDTAHGNSKGRSDTLNFFHGSEVGFWKEIKPLLASMQSLTDDSIQILESTANGMNDFYDLWKEDNNYENLFYEWWRTKEYKTKFVDEREMKRFNRAITKAKKGEYDPDEEDWVYDKLKWLRDEIGLSMEQMLWYYDKWKDLKLLIMQEYPCTPDESFLASGNCVFPVNKLIRRKNSLEKQYKLYPPKRGYFKIQWNDEETHDKIVDFTWIDDVNGVIEIVGEIDAKTGKHQYNPKDRYPYVLGGDTKGEGKDHFASMVKNNNTGVRVASLWGDKMTSTEFYTWQLYCLGKYYNYGMISIEINFNSYPIKELERLGYDNQYIRMAYDDYKDKYMEKHGWRTDGNNRMLIIEKEINMVQNHIEWVQSIEFINQCLTFIDNGKRYEHEVGKHDDLIFADMIMEETSTSFRHTILEAPIQYKEKLIKKLERNQHTTRRL